MRRIKEWVRRFSFGDEKKYWKLVGWFFFDSIVATIPYSLLLGIIYVLFLPVQKQGTLRVEQLWMLTGVLFLQAVAYFFVRKRSYVDSCVGMADTMRTSRMKMGEHLRCLPMGFYQDRDAGDLSTVLLRDYNTVETLAQQFAPQIAVTIVRIALSVLLLAIFDWRMTVALFITIPLAIPFAVISYRRLEDSGAALQQAQQDVTSEIFEYVEGMQTLKAFNVAGEHFTSLKNAFQKQRESAIHIETKTAAPVSVFGRVVLNLGIVLVILLGGYLTAECGMQPFFYIAFLVMALNVYEPVSILFLSIVDFARSKRSSDRIEAIFAEKPLEQIKEMGVKKEQPDAVAFEHVDFSYGNHQVLHDISFTCKENTVTALVGPSGSGKSTITRLVARFYDTDAGVVTMNGVPLKAQSADEVLEKVSIVFQDVYLFHDTIAENIRMGKENATMEEVIAAAKKAACHDFIMALPNQYDTVVGEGGSTLSGGEKQRISIARALLKDAPIILLDEATASLDPENEVQVQQAISSLVAEKTVIIVAHRLQSVFNADNIIVLKDGRIAESGTHQQLLEKKGIYADLWREQSSAGEWKIR